jgi:hypothetical protein
VTSVLADGPEQDEPGTDSYLQHRTVSVREFNELIIWTDVLIDIHKTELR